MNAVPDQVAATTALTNEISPNVNQHERNSSGHAWVTLTCKRRAICS